MYLIDRQRAFRFQQILDSMNDGVIAVDETGRIFYANPAYVSILGVPLRRIMGKMIVCTFSLSMLSTVLVPIISTRVSIISPSRKAPLPITKSNSALRKRRKCRKELIVLRRRFKQKILNWISSGQSPY